MNKASRQAHHLNTEDMVWASLIKENFEARLRHASKSRVELYINSILFATTLLFKNGDIIVPTFWIQQYQKKASIGNNRICTTRHCL